MDNNQLEFTRMVKKYQSTIYSVCLMFGNDTEDTNDLMQEALIRLWKDMIRQTVENRIEKIQPSNTMNYLSLLISIVLFPALVLWMTIVKDMYSLQLGIFTVFMCWTTAYRTYEGMHLKTMETVHNGSILDVSEAISKMRQMYNRHKIFTYSILTIWIGWFLIENYHELLGSTNDIILASIVFVFVFAGLSTSFSRIERITSQTLRDIKNYR